MKQQVLTPASRIRSFRFAIRGIGKFFREEPNAWIHLCATIALFIAGCYFRVSVTEWLALTVVVGLVWVAEAFNTVVERIVDFISPGYHRQAGLIKDISAGAVLLASCTAIVVGAIVFIPKIF